MGPPHIRIRLGPPPKLAQNCANRVLVPRNKSMLGLIEVSTSEHACGSLCFPHERMVSRIVDAMRGQDPPTATVDSLYCRRAGPVHRQPCLFGPKILIATLSLFLLVKISPQHIDNIQVHLAKISLRFDHFFRRAVTRNRVPTYNRQDGSQQYEHDGIQHQQ